MFAVLKSISLAALVSLGALASTPALAQSDGYLGLGGGRNGPSVEFFIGDGDGFGRHDRDRRYDRDHRRYDRDDRRHGPDWDRPRGCSAERALRKAERIGIRRARIVDISRRSIEIAGRARGERVFIAFARVPGCPVINR